MTAKSFSSDSWDTTDHWSPTEISQIRP